jgi:hypothetical protein
MMKIGFSLASALLAMALLPCSRLTAQQPGPTPNNQQCNIPIHSSKETDRKAKILAKPDPNYDRDDRRRHAFETIVLRAVLCGSGQVTDIKVKSGPSDSANTKAIEAARKIQFIPGEKGGEKVSTLVNLLYQIQP